MPKDDERKEMTQEEIDAREEKIPHLFYHQCSPGPGGDDPAGR